MKTNSMKNVYNCCTANCKCYLKVNDIGQVFIKMYEHKHKDNFNSLEHSKDTYKLRFNRFKSQLASNVTDNSAYNLFKLEYPSVSEVLYDFKEVRSFFFRKKQKLPGYIAQPKQLDQISSWINNTKLKHNYWQQKIDEYDSVIKEYSNNNNNNNNNNNVIASEIFKIVPFNSSIPVIESEQDKLIASIQKQQALLQYYNNLVSKKLGCDEYKSIFFRGCLMEI